MADEDIPDEQQPWFPGLKSQWSLDIVTLLAVIGEASMAEHSQAITASVLCLVPRLLPAPQALLKASRPTRMPETRAKMTGVFSGVTVDSVGFFANIIAPIDRYPAFAFCVFEIKHTNEVLFDVECPATTKKSDPAGWRQLLLPPYKLPPGGIKGFLKGRNGAKAKVDDDIESGSGGGGSGGGGGGGGKGNGGTVFSEGGNDGNSPPCGEATTMATATGNDIELQQPRPMPGKLQRQRTLKEKATDVLTTFNPHKRPAVPAKFWSPLHVLTVFSFFLSAAIIAAAVHWKDGNAIIAVSFISLASSVVGFASWWEPRLMSLQRRNKVPKSDVMIRTREGAFIYIKCTESVARELFAGTEECKYRVGSRTYNALMAFGTVILMLAVVLLGNCKWNSQMFIGGSYIVLNGMYWALGMIPKQYFWDLSRYEVIDKTPEDAVRADRDLRDAAGRKVPDPERLASYTRSLWYAIRETGTKGWVERSGAAPGTDRWKRWLDEAEKMAKAGKRDWQAVTTKDRILAEADHAEQHAPATEVQVDRNAQPTGSL